MTTAKELVKTIKRVVLTSVFGHKEDCGVEQFIVRLQCAAILHAAGICEKTGNQTALSADHTQACLGLAIRLKMEAHEIAVKSWFSK